MGLCLQRLPAAAGSVWLQTQGSVWSGCFSERTAPSPGDSSDSAAPPELLLEFETYRPSDWPGDRPPRRTNAAPTQPEKHITTATD